LKNSEKEKIDNDYLTILSLENDINDFDIARKDFLELSQDGYCKKYHNRHYTEICRLRQNLVEKKRLYSRKITIIQNEIEKELDPIFIYINIYYNTYNDEREMILSEKKMEEKKKEMIQDEENLIQISEKMSTIEKIFDTLSRK